MCFVWVETEGRNFWSKVENESALFFASIFSAVDVFKIWKVLWLIQCYFVIAIWTVFSKKMSKQTITQTAKQTNKTVTRCLSPARAFKEHEWTSSFETDASQFESHKMSERNQWTAATYYWTVIALFVYVGFHTRPSVFCFQPTLISGLIGHICAFISTSQPSVTSQLLALPMTWGYRSIFVPSVHSLY